MDKMSAKIIKNIANTLGVIQEQFHVGLDDPRALWR